MKSSVLEKLVKEKYNTSTSEEKMYMNSYLAASSSFILNGLEIGFLIFLSFGLFTWFLGGFFLNSIYQTPFILMEGIFMLMGITCLILYFRKRKEILIKLVKFKK